MQGEQADIAHDWVGALRAAAERLGSIKKVAEAIGYSRSTVSLVLAGKYDRDQTRMAEAVRVRLGQIGCPYLQQSITGQVCGDHQRRAEPAPEHEEYWHWRACQSCRVGLGKGGARHES